jgi:hypothetical protein
LSGTSKNPFGSASIVAAFGFQLSFFEGPLCHLLYVHPFLSSTLASAVCRRTERVLDCQPVYENFPGCIQICRHANFPEKTHLVSWPFIAGKQEALFGCKKIIDDIHSEKD